MKWSLLNAFLVLALATACVSTPQPAPARSTPAPAGRIRTPEQAIEVVRRHIRHSGGDPQREEISAVWREGLWRVMAWHIWYPNNTGGSRFVPGGHTFYTVDTQGRITDTMAGR